MIATIFTLAGIVIYLFISVLFPVLIQTQVISIRVCFEMFSERLSLFYSWFCYLKAVAHTKQIYKDLSNFKTARQKVLLIEKFANLFLFISGMDIYTNLNGIKKNWRTYNNWIIIGTFIGSTINTLYFYRSDLNKCLQAISFFGMGIIVRVAYANLLQIKKTKSDF